MVSFPSVVVVLFIHVTVVDGCLSSDIHVVLRRRHGYVVNIDHLFIRLFFFIPLAAC